MENEEEERKITDLERENETRDSKASMGRATKTFLHSPKGFLVQRSPLLLGMSVVIDVAPA